MASCAPLCDPHRSAGRTGQPAPASCSSRKRTRRSHPAPCRRQRAPASAAALMPAARAASRSPAPVQFNPFAMSLDPFQSLVNCSANASISANTAAARLVSISTCFAISLNPPEHRDINHTGKTARGMPAASLIHLSSEYSAWNTVISEQVERKLCAPLGCACPPAAATLVDPGRRFLAQAQEDRLPVLCRLVHFAAAGHVQEQAGPHAAPPRRVRRAGDHDGRKAAAGRLLGQSAQDLSPL